MKDAELRYKSGKNKGEIIDKYVGIIKELKYEGATSKVFRLHLKSWTGSHKKPRLVDNESNYIKVLEVYGIKYSKGNDAPKGGITGDYIEVIVDRRNPFWKEKTIE